MESNNSLQHLNDKIYKIEELNLEMNRNLLILSRSNSGKSILIKNLIHYYILNFNFNSVILYSKTCKYETEYDFIDDRNKFDGSLDGLINNILDFQKESNNKMKILLILDDVDVTKKNDLLSDLFTKSRHWNITLILSSQYVKQLVSSTIRSNFHYLFWNQLNLDNLECIYRIVYLNIDKKSFFQWVYNVKERFAFIFYDNTHIGNDISENYKLCKADIKEFKLKL